MKKVEDMTFDQFNKLAVTEILTGERFITEGQSELMENSLIYNALQVPVGSTTTYTPSTKPAAEIDTHGTFKSAILRKEALNTINRYYDELQHGGWIGYTTGSYGDAVVGTPKFNPRLNSKIESKVKTLKDEFAKEGFTFTRDPKNPGFHIVKKKPVFNFSASQISDSFSGDLYKDNIYKNLAARRKDYYKGKVEALELRRDTLIELNDLLKTYRNQAQKIYDKIHRDVRNPKFHNDVLRFAEINDRLKTLMDISEKVRDERKAVKISDTLKNTQETVEDLPYAVSKSPSRWTTSISFLEDSVDNKINSAEKKAALKQVNAAIKKALASPKTSSAYKYSRVDQATREVLKATQIDLGRRGDTLSLQQLAQLDGLVTNKIQEGKDYIKGVKEANNKNRDKIRNAVSGIVQLSPKDAPSYSKRNEFSSKLKRLKLSNLLAPASNNDFEGLLYRMLPKGSRRLATFNYLREQLLDPLTQANAEHLVWKDKLRNQWTQNKKILDDAGLSLHEDSGITLENEEGSYDLTLGEVVKAYNYAKDPNLNAQMERGGFDFDKVNKVIDYVQGNTAIRNYADGIANTYATVAPAINKKLNEHGRRTFTLPRIDKDNLAPEEIEILEKIYDKVPSHAVYTPLTAEGADLDTQIDNLLKDGNFQMYSVMDGRLKERTRGGKVNIAGTNPDSEFESYLRGPVRTLAFMDFARNASNFFGKDQLASMKNKYGDTWNDSMKDSLQRIVTGRNIRGRNTGAGKFIERTLQRQVGGVMFFNMRSALLQHLSYFNYYFDDFNAMRRGQTVSREVKKEIAEKIRPYLQDRGKGRTDLLVDELFGRGNSSWIDTAIQSGYSLTKRGDRNAITFGGAPFMAGKYQRYIEQGMDPKKAMDAAYNDFLRVTEASQQSTNPERLGKEQTTPIGRYLLAFANTPQQYNRKISRAVQDLRGLAGVKGPEAKARRRQAIGEVMWYMGAQNAIFTSLQSLSFAALGVRFWG